MTLRRYLNVVEAVLVDRYGDEPVERWLDPPPLPTVESWGTGMAAAAGQAAFMADFGER